MYKTAEVEENVDIDTMDDKWEETWNIQEEFERGLRLVVDSACLCKWALD